MRRVLLPLVLLVLALLPAPALALDNPYVWALAIVDPRPVQVGAPQRMYEVRARRISPDPNTLDHVAYVAITDQQNLGWQYQRTFYINADPIEGFNVWRGCTFVKPFSAGRYISCQRNGVWQAWEFLPY